MGCDTLCSVGQTSGTALCGAEMVCDILCSKDMGCAIVCNWDMKWDIVCSRDMGCDIVYGRHGVRHCVGLRHGGVTLCWQGQCVENIVCTAQKRSVRALFATSQQQHSRDIFLNHKILPLDKLINQQEGILVYKSDQWHILAS